MPTALLYPMAAHVALTALLYVVLTLARAPTVWGFGQAPDGTSPFKGLERQVSANLSNQFEWPLFFYTACLLLIGLRLVDPVQIWLAWGFVVGRIAHSLVQVLTVNVRARGLVFTLNFLAVLGMWVRLVTHVAKLQS